jgi:hypothetical protein
VIVVGLVQTRHNPDRCREPSVSSYCDMVASSRGCHKYRMSPSLRLEVDSDRKISRGHSSDGEGSVHQDHGIDDRHILGQSLYSCLVIESDVCDILCPVGHQACSYQFGYRVFLSCIDGC